MHQISERDEAAALAALAGAARARLAAMPAGSDDVATPYPRAVGPLLHDERQVLAAWTEFIAEVVLVLPARPAEMFVVSATSVASELP